MSAVKLVSFSDDNTGQIVETVAIEPGETAASFKKRHVEPGNSLWQVLNMSLDVKVLDDIIEQGGGVYEKYLYKVSRKKAQTARILTSPLPLTIFLTLAVASRVIDEFCIRKNEGSTILKMTIIWERQASCA